MHQCWNIVLRHFTWILAIRLFLFYSKLCCKINPPYRVQILYKEDKILLIEYFILLIEYKSSHFKIYPDTMYGLFLSIWARHFLVSFQKWRQFIMSFRELTKKWIRLFKNGKGNAKNICHKDDIFNYNFVYVVSKD